MIKYSELTNDNVEETITFWQNTPGVHLHNNGEDTYEGIVSYLSRNP